VRVARQRLSPERRREQLLQIGARLFAENPYEDVWIEEVAELAGVSRGLLYHYFPTKRDFYVAVIESHSAWLLELSKLDPALPLAGQVRAAIAAYLDYVEQNPATHRTLHRSLTSGDAQVKAIVDRGMAGHTDNILATIGAAGDPVARVAVRGWLSFVLAACFEWQDNAEITRDQLSDLCVRVLLGALEA
jgi:AcrR family transcriptional regulator